jgi:hypothetical protein
MKAYGGVDVWSYIFLTSALAGGKWSASRPNRFTPGERVAGTHWIRDWLDPKAGLNPVGKIFLPYRDSELQPFVRPARSQSLYRLQYPSSYQQGALRN